MKNLFYAFLTVIFISFIFLFSSPAKAMKNTEKITSDTVRLTDVWNGRSLTVDSGTILDITTQNNEDGGYTNIAPVSNENFEILYQRHIPPADPSVMGDSGKDIWGVKVKKSGVFALEIVRKWEKDSKRVKFQISVNVSDTDLQQVAACPIGKRLSADGWHCE